MQTYRRSNNGGATQIQTQREVKANDKAGDKPAAKPAQWRQKGDSWVLEIGGKIVAEVDRKDNGEHRWQRMTTIAEHGLPPAGGKATRRRDAQKKAWPK